MEDIPIKLECNNSIANLIINRPEKKNALTQAMWAAIPRLINDINQDNNIRVLIIKGGGAKDFSAGADINEFLDVRKDKHSAQTYEKQNVDAFNAIKQCQKPTIAMIRGICFGGGFGLAASCDLRIASKNARFAIPAAKLGLAYPLAAISSLMSALGEQNTKALLYSGAELTAQEASKKGFLLARIKNKYLHDTTYELADKIAQNAPLTLSATKAGIHAILSNQDKAWKLAEEWGDMTFDSQDYQEGILAFKERRKANFKGK
jgi:enoyl-CoA hydratase/carnithine racemase